MGKYIYIKVDSCQDCPYCRYDKLYAYCTKLEWPLLSIDKVDEACPLPEEE